MCEALVANPRPQAEWVGETGWELCRPLRFVIVGGEQGNEGGRGLDWNRIGIRGNEDVLGEGVGAVVQHALGECMRLGEGLDSKVAEHGVGFPVAHKLDGVFVDTGTEEGGGPTWPEAASAEKSTGRYLW